MQRVCVIPGDDAAPEAMMEAVRVLRAMELPLEYEVLPAGDAGVKEHGSAFYDVCREAIDRAAATLFGATSGKTPALRYLRWERDAYANVRPIRYFPGLESPLRDPGGIDFVIVRENSEDLYVGVEGELEQLAGLGFRSRITQRPIPASGGRFALKVITEAASRRVVEFAFRLARARGERLGRPGRVTAACKHNMLPRTDGLFRTVALEVAAANPDVAFEEYIVDDMARRIISDAHRLDVVVLPNLYGDILSDEASALVGGLGVAPSGNYGDGGFAYFEPVHGTAPDIAGEGVINPTATLLSAAMMLEHLGLETGSAVLVQAVEKVYGEGRSLTRDQGGTASTAEFANEVMRAL